MQIHELLHLLITGELIMPDHPFSFEKYVILRSFDLSLVSSPGNEEIDISVRLFDMKNQ